MECFEAIKHTARFIDIRFFETVSGFTVRKLQLVESFNLDFTTEVSLQFLRKLHSKGSEI